MGEFGHLGLPRGAGHVLRHSHLDAAPPWAILACRVCRLGGIGRSTQRRAPGERGAVRTSQAAHPLAHRVLRAARPGVAFLSRWSSVRMLLSPRPWCTRRSSVQSSRLQQLVLLVDDASSAWSRRQQEIVRRPISFVLPGLHSSQRPLMESEWPTPAPELQHSWLLVLRTWGCTEPTFLPFGCTSAVCEGEE